MGKKSVIARLRDGKDEDLKQSFSELPAYYDEADILREALRQFFYGHLGREPLIVGGKITTKPVESQKKVDVHDNQEVIELEEVDDDINLNETLDTFLK